MQSGLGIGHWAEPGRISKNLENHDKRSLDCLERIINRNVDVKDFVSKGPQEVRGMLGHKSSQRISELLGTDC